MARPAKSLAQHVRDHSFRPERHASLLVTDRSIDRMAFEDDDPELRYWAMLFELVLWYRHEAKRDRDRRECALAFRDAIDRRYERYDELMEGRYWKEVDGKLQLREPDREEEIAHEIEFLSDLWKGLVEVEDEPAESRLSSPVRRRAYGGMTSWWRYSMCRGR